MAGKVRLARRSAAEGTAALVLRELGIISLRVNPIRIAEEKDIFVQAKPDLHDGVSGMLVKAGDAFGILYATKIKSPGFQNFSIAHELGHYCIEGHFDALMSTGTHASHAGFSSADPFEQEADFFAAALLMPELPFRREIGKLSMGIEAVKHLADACEASLTATAIRYAGLTRDAVAVIVSTGDRIDYCFMSEGMKEAKGITWLRKGTPVPAKSITHSFNTDPGKVRSGSEDLGEGSLNDWMGGDHVHRVQEQVIGLGTYGRTLTVLSSHQLSQAYDPDPDDDDDEDALVESWTPRFRK